MQCPHEHGPVGGRRAFELQVVGNGAARGHRQRQNVFAAALGSAQRDGAGAPVDVVEPKLGDFATAQAEVQRAARDGGGAARRWAIVAERAQQTVDLGGAEGLWQRCQLPVGRIADHADQTMYLIATRGAKAEVASQRRG